MGSFRALTFASIVAVAAVQTAKAADLLPPPPPIEAPLRGPMIEESGFYMRADAGLSNTNASDLRSTFGDGSTLASQGALVSASGVATGDPGLLGLGVGYQFNSWFRADLTGEYRTASAFRSYYNAEWNGSAGCNVNSGMWCTDEYVGQVKAGVVLANGYLDMGTWYGFTPYVGAGVGLAAYQVSNIKDTSLLPNGTSPWGVAPSSNGVNFAWALMAGASYHITPNLLLDVGYRYVDMGTLKTGAIACNNQVGGSCHFETQHFKMASNDVRVGLRWIMAAQNFYEPGVRAKY